MATASIARFKALSARRIRTEDELTEEFEAAIVDTADDPEAVLQAKNRRELLRDRRATDQRDELASLHSMTSSASC